MFVCHYLQLRLLAENVLWITGHQLCSRIDHLYFCSRELMQSVSSSMDIDCNNLDVVNKPDEDSTARSSCDPRNIVQNNIDGPPICQ
jgi:hypothetical protein